ncbi:hypothetical protein BV372_10645 [Nostoc sp. T09]|uniref:hypothetical protein n=1 Tax=Nostoc sp. T09 TaxID=1932621 RepID=UPI000A3AC61B|nr:hypothetical protein [Nostoc sp. T09]OUL35583.1 hypothetical protein BV372_10645 [Nostoc sp. T09]
MFTSIVLLFILALIIPFFIAQMMPTVKWLIIYTISFGTLALLQHYKHLTTPSEQRGNGFAYLLGVGLIRFIYTSGVVGIINRAIILNYTSRGYRINIWFIVYIITLDVMLIYIAFLMWQSERI